MDKIYTKEEKFFYFAFILSVVFSVIFAVRFEWPLPMKIFVIMGIFGAVIFIIMGFHSLLYYFNVKKTAKKENKKIWLGWGYKKNKKHR